MRNVAPSMRTLVSVDSPSLKIISKLSASVSVSRRQPFHFLAMDARLEPSVSRTLKVTSSQRAKWHQGPRILSTWLPTLSNTWYTGFHQVALSLTVPTVSPLTETVSAWKLKKYFNQKGFFAPKAAIAIFGLWNFIYILAFYNHKRIVQAWERAWNTAWKWAWKRANLKLESLRSHSL